MASVPPVTAAPEQENILVRLARALMARESHKLGIPEQEQRAALADSEVDLRRAQAAYYLGGGNRRVAAAPNVGSFEDFVLRKYGSNPTPQQIAEARAEWAATGQAPQREPQRAPAATGSFEDYIAADPSRRAEIEAARKAYNQSDDRAPTTRTAISLQLPVAVMDKKTGQLVYATKEDVLANPDRYVPPPTAAERNAASGSTATQQGLKMAQQRAMPVLQDIGSRALALNKGGDGGMMSRIGGAARGAAGRIGMDPSADLYRTGIRGFVPLFARAVGHVGVLTELDVSRTEDLFPRIGDAENVTREKLGRLQRIMTGQEPMPFQFEQPSYDEEGITQSEPAQPASGGGFRVVGVRDK